MTRNTAETGASVEKSRAETESILTRYGAHEFGYVVNPNQRVIVFSVKGRRVKFVLPLPDRDADEFKRTQVRRYVRSPEERMRAWEQACRQRWRALALAIKAKLEAVACGITTFEEEFLAHIVLPDGQTVGGWMIPQVAHAYEHGRMPPLLGMGSPA